MRTIRFVDALNEALREEMKRDSSVFIMGEEVGVSGGAYKVSRGLIDEFGPERVRDTPISEDGFMGAGVGAAMLGMKPVVEIMYNDFLCCAMNQLVNIASKVSYMSAGQLKVPMVVRTMIGQGRGRGTGGEHAQVLIPWVINVPGLKLVVPSTPYDAKGLLKTAIRDGSPVVYFENATLYATKGPVPEGEYTIPFGEADVKRKGSDFTIVAVSSLVSKVLSAADRLAKEGIDLEVIDPRTLVPLDKQTIIGSVKKTGKLITVEPSHKTGGIGAELAAMVAEEAYDYLKMPVLRVACPDIPIPVSPPLEKAVLVDEDTIIDNVRKVASKT